MIKTLAIERGTERITGRVVIKSSKILCATNAIKTLESNCFIVCTIIAQRANVIGVRDGTTEIKTSYFRELFARTIRARCGL